MKRHNFSLFIFLLSLVLGTECFARQVERFDFNWKFTLADSAFNASATTFDDSKWRTLNLPHDWSIESDFGKDYPATAGGGALPGGIGWYRKSFTANTTDKGKKFFIEFDGIYRNSEVWINGKLLGKRPNGYISFRYDMTPYVRFGQTNVIAVKADNAKQPNSRWYSGSGIYRHVRLLTSNPVYVAYNGTYVTTPKVSASEAEINVETTLRNDKSELAMVTVEQSLYDAAGKLVAQTTTNTPVKAKHSQTTKQQLKVVTPTLWDIESPYLYTLVTRLKSGKTEVDRYETTVGLRSFSFDVHKGFILNGKQIKINGVCNHHDLGALGAAINERALERQLEIMKAMGVNGIRTSHNPPAPELLALSDKIGFIVMDEAFDIWRKKKSTFDYALDFEKWHKQDLIDQIVRDRNHPSVFIWSIGNEVVEQWGEEKEKAIGDMDLQQANILLNNRKVDHSDANGKLGKNAQLTKHLADITKATDPTRPVTAACNGTDDKNPLFLSGALDIIGFNYHENEYEGITARHPNNPFIVTESVSSLNTRGYYVNPSDSIIVCPKRWDIPYTDPSQQCSAYDNCHAPWGSTHETTLKIVKKFDHIAGQYIWTGIDYLGEPTPYWWPSRSSFFGIVDLAGFPKDVFYLYKSEWTKENVLHIFPHWNWKVGETIDIWAYYNNADEVELYLNGASLGKRVKKGDEMHVVWRVHYFPGTLKAVSRKAGKEVMTTEVKTAEKPVSIRLTADRNKIKADGRDLSFVTVELVDEDGVASPLANQLVKFSVVGEGDIVGTDNGNQNDHVSLKKPERNLFYGKCLAIVQNRGKAGVITLKAEVEGLPTQTIEIEVK